MVSEAGELIIAQGAYSVSIGGGQPNTGAPAATGVHVNGTKTLRSSNAPECNTAEWMKDQMREGNLRLDPHDR